MTLTLLLWIRTKISSGHLTAFEETTKKLLNIIAGKKSWQVYAYHVKLLTFQWFCKAPGGAGQHSYTEEALSTTF